MLYTFWIIQYIHHSTSIYSLFYILCLGGGGEGEIKEVPNILVISTYSSSSYKFECEMQHNKSKKKLNSYFSNFRNFTSEEVKGNIEEPVNKRFFGNRIYSQFAYLVCKVWTQKLYCCNYCRHSNNFEIVLLPASLIFVANLDYELNYGRLDR